MNWQQKKTKKFKRENWVYDKVKDTYTCPNDQTLYFKYEKKDISINGYERTVQVYQSQTCEGCPFASECKRSEDKNRTVQHSQEGERYKEEAKLLLDTEGGKDKRQQRSIEVETAFGDIKFNGQHRRFVLRGKNKVYIEYGLLAIGHNLRKVYCKESGIWADYYVQRAAKKTQKGQKRA